MTAENHRRVETRMEVGAGFNEAAADDRGKPHEDPGTAPAPEPLQ